MRETDAVHNYFSTWGDYLFSYFHRPPEDQALFESYKKSLAEYEARVGWELLNDLLRDILKKRGTIQETSKEATDVRDSKAVLCSPELQRIILGYVNYLFVLVHAAFRFASVPAIGEDYFCLLKTIEEFFIFIHTQFPQQMSESMQNAALKIILIFNTWDKILEKNQSGKPYSDRPLHHAQKYFKDLYMGKKYGDEYDKYMVLTYEKFSKNVKKKCLQSNLAQLGELHKKQAEFDNASFFSAAPIDEIKRPLIKYKNV